MLATVGYSFDNPALEMISSRGVYSTQHKVKVASKNVFIDDNKVFSTHFDKTNPDYYLKCTDSAQAIIQKRLRHTRGIKNAVCFNH